MPPLFCRAIDSLRPLLAYLKAHPFLLAWAFVLLADICHPLSPFYTGQLMDGDDYLHLLQARLFANGTQGWFDTTLPNFGTPPGVTLHFSRLADLPLFFLALPMTALFGAEGWWDAALVLPLFLIGALFFLTQRLAQAWRAPRWLGPLVAVCSIPLLMQFQPGRVDHHGLNLLLEAGALLLTARLTQQVSDRHGREAALIGVLSAIMLAIALETLPFVALLLTGLGLWLALHGRPRDLVLLAASFAAAMAALDLALIPPAARYAVAFEKFSFLYVLLAQMGAAWLLAAAAVAARPAMRPIDGVAILTAAGLALILAALMLWPDLRLGPYAGTPAPLRDMLYRSITEMQPYSHALHRPRVAGFLLWLVLGFALALHAWHQRRVSAANLALAALPPVGLFLLTLFGEGRFSAQASLTALPLFLIGAPALLARWPRPVLAALLMGPLVPLFLPGFMIDATLRTQLLFYPIPGHEESCPLGPVYYELANNPRLMASATGHQPVVLSPLNEAGRLLYYTQARVLAGPYHTDIEGNLAAMDFFLAGDEEKAEDVLRRQHVDLVLICRSAPTDFLRDADLGTLARMGGMPVGGMEGKTRNMAQRLLAGETPSWLVPIKPALGGEYLMFTPKLPPAATNGGARAEEPAAMGDDMAAKKPPGKIRRLFDWVKHKASKI